MIVQKEIWSDIPLLHVFDNSMTIETPTVFILHGHISAKEHNLHYAYQLNKKGIRVILPDALMHGDRYNGETEQQLTLNFWDIVQNSIKEVNELYREGITRNLFKKNNIGMHGVSMGAITTAACLSMYEWIKTASICMGVTNLSALALHQLETIVSKNSEFNVPDEMKEYIVSSLSKFNLENDIDLFYRKPVIFWHGQQDPIVPIQFSYPFYENNLKNSKAEYLKDDKAAHAVTREGLIKVTSFIAQHLSE